MFIINNLIKDISEMETVSLYKLTFKTELLFIS